MKRMTMIVGVLLAVAVVATASTGCAFVIPGPHRVGLDQTRNVTAEPTRNIPLRDAIRVSARIAMGQGDLNLSGEKGSAEALNADFSYSRQSWRPVVDYTVSGNNGRLDVEQPTPTDSLHLLTPPSNTWALILNGSVPTDLALDLGMVRGDIDLSTIDVRNLTLENGISDSTIDLTGPRANDVTARVEAEAGSVTILLPRDVPVIVRTGDWSPGHVNASGFVREGDSWVNDAWKADSVRGRTPRGPSIDVSVDRGVAEVTLVLAD